MKEEYWLTCPKCLQEVIEYPATKDEKSFCECTDCDWIGDAHDCGIDCIGWENHGAKYEAGQI